MADYAITEDGEKVDLTVDVDVVTRDDGTVKRVIVNGIDMTLWIAAEGFAIRPASHYGKRTLVDMSLVAKNVTYRTEE